MTVNPGFGGSRSLTPASQDNVASRMLDKRGLETELERDAVSSQTISHGLPMRERCLCCGSAVFAAVITMHNQRTEASGGGTGAVKPSAFVTGGLFLSLLFRLKLRTYVRIVIMDDIL